MSTFPFGTREALAAITSSLSESVKAARSTAENTALTVSCHNGVHGVQARAMTLDQRIGVRIPGGSQFFASTTYLIVDVRVENLSRTLRARRYDCAAARLTLAGKGAWFITNQ